MRVGPGRSAIRHPPFQPLDDRTQPTPVVDLYAETARRTPAEAPVEAPPTLASLAGGPSPLTAKLAAGDGDLHAPDPRRPALGVRILVTGVVRDSDGRGVPGAVIEIWQANAAGRYRHDAGGSGPIDPGFAGFGRIRTDADGRYRFLSIKPGAYPVRTNPGRWWRPPHIHLSVLPPGMDGRLVTQVYFPGDPLNDLDRILQAIPDADARASLVMRPMPTTAVPLDDTLGFERDLVLRGRHATPPTG